MDPGYGSIEGGGDASCGSASDKVFDFVFGEVKPLSDGGTDGGTDLNDGTFPTGGKASADGDGGGDEFYDTDSRANFAFIIGDGLHDFWNARAFGFLREKVYDGTNDEASEHRE